MTNDAVMPRPTELAEALREMGLSRPGEDVVCTPLSGGISSEIWRVDGPRGIFCVKRALSKLKVASDWRVPTDRWRSEVAWLRRARVIVGSGVPRVVGVDETRGFFAMEYLPPESFPVWKQQLRTGRADVAVARDVARLLSAVHNATAMRDDVAAEFATDAMFYDLRIEPFLLATAQKHPDLAARLGALAHTTMATKLALVHGDVSPKNVLVGKSGPVLLDAECAWYGDPAFDVAFCLNHLLLKCLWVPPAAAEYLACFSALRDSYIAEVTWETARDLEARAAALLPALALARIDGKSPAEYVTHAADKSRVRRVAGALLRDPVDSLDTVKHIWAKEFASAS